MKRIITMGSVLATFAAMGLLLVACGEQDASVTEDVSVIEASLDQDNGGYDLNDESVLFAPAELNLPAGFDFNEDAIRNAEVIMSQIPELPEGVLEDQAAMPTDEGDPSALPAPEVGAPETDDQAKKPDCPKLLMLGKWKAIKKGFGIFRAVLVAPTPWDTNQKGKVVGFVKGIYGKGRFFGKAVRKGGSAMALLKGHYGKGHFKGRLKTRKGVAGIVRGKYGPNRLAGVLALLCKPLCEKICPDSMLVGDDGGCRCLRPCADGQAVDACPRKVRVCVQVAVSDKDDTNAAGDANFKPVRTECRVRCAPPACRPMDASTDPAAGEPAAAAE